ncbi:MAG: metallophosphoesterase [Calditrichaeota bacterium]|nr:MAG: metallophosphoesterase [Calditrichota bacterium]
MRVALLSDIHGNHMALDAVLYQVENERPDMILVLGDVATIGPEPRAVLERLRSLNARFIMGNHDRVLLDPTQKKAMRIAPILYPDVEWCRGLISRKDLAFINTFEERIDIPLEGNDRLLAYHGSPRSEVENIYPTSDDQQLADLLPDDATRVYCGGHTHIQMVRNYKGKWLVNPGSVGQPFHHTPMNGEAPLLLPHAEWALLEWRAGHPEIRLIRTSYDTAAYRRILQESELPIREWLLLQYK